MARGNLIYITGVPGSGKSAVCHELKRRGYAAHDVDNGIAFFYNNATGKSIDEHVPAEDRTPDWRAQHSWRAKREAVEAVAAGAGSGPSFLCGITANDADELWDLFSQVFALVISDEQTLRERVADRSEDGFGKNPHELSALLQMNQTAGAYYKELGATLIDASQPVEKVVDTILRLAAGA
jgi:thymidylate kinase